VTAVCCPVKTQYVTSFGQQYDGPNSLSFPIGVTESPDGTVVVCDTHHNVVKMFNKDGIVINTMVG